MRIDILTLFPDMFAPVINESIMGRAVAGGILQIHLHNIRDYADNKHRQVDDYPFGGGAGMLMMPQPIFDCMEAVEKLSPIKGKRIYLSPRGKVFNNKMAREMATEERLILLCGHYEGVDQRVIDNIIDMELSIGDFVTTGGELPAMVMTDCIARFIPGVLGDKTGADEESFEGGLLEYPQYTRPSDFRGMKVPEVLLSGHHANIVKWQREQSEKITRAVRPDLLSE
ncbi:tRNA (guanosine(37)-N1)-methyltransferase TrmD [Clostridia bacterium OttesenSCG-928-F22]|nr:tRNA (guanosine(37)-N1)-methyltransferase TrmD [Clostridia bacterium OttesenSCG-928-F22]